MADTIFMPGPFMRKIHGMKITDPAFNYDLLGQNYSSIRQTDTRIAAFIHEALGSAATVINVGAGSGSYEPEDKYVVAVEPSVTMRAQRKGKVPAMAGRADALPFDDNAFDAAMAIVTIHHWPDVEKGLKELRRVAKQQVVILTFDPDEMRGFWNVNYFPELVAVEQARFPKTEQITRTLGGSCELKRCPYRQIAGMVSRRLFLRVRRLSSGSRYAALSLPGAS